jgi:hypothetical protein
MASTFELALEKYTELETKVLKRFMEDHIKPLAIVADPEKLIGKPFEQWQPQDAELLSKIYGPEEPNIFTDFMLEKEVEEIRNLKQQTGGA